jgi:hypothetical protein
MWSRRIFTNRRLPISAILSEGTQIRFLRSLKHEVLGGGPLRYRVLLSLFQRFSRLDLRNTPAFLGYIDEQYRFEQFPFDEWLTVSKLRDFDAVYKSNDGQLWTVAHLALTNVTEVEIRPSNDSKPMQASGDPKRTGAILDSTIAMEVADPSEPIGVLRRSMDSSLDEKDWTCQITHYNGVFSTRVSVLTISTGSICWKELSFRLDSISRVRWGGVTHSLDDRTTEIIYIIGFGDSRLEAVVEQKDVDIYRAVIERLWRTVGVRLYREMLEGLKAGREIQLPDAVLHDDGVTLVKRKLLGATEKVRFPWNSIRTWSENGDFCVQAVSDRHIRAT